MSSEESCIEDVIPVIKYIAGRLISKTSKNITMSLDGDKFDEIIELYEKIRELLKSYISKDTFLINQFKISAILSLSLQVCKPLNIKNDSKLESYYNGLLAYLVSEQIIKKFEDNEHFKMKHFKKSFRKSMIKFIRMNGESLQDALNNNDSKRDVSTLILNMSQQYHLLYDTSLCEMHKN